MKLWRRRSVPVPTIWGWALLLVLSSTPLVLWTVYGEQYLAVTSRAPADVLIVEAWLNEDAATAALAEFSRPGQHYRYLVATGGLTGERWSRQRWHEVEIVGRELQRQQFPMAAFITAEARDTETQRTFASAIAARDELQRRAIKPTAVNVITRGAHARRSQIVFQKAFGSHVPVGVVSWQPPGYGESRWWQSSERAVEFMKESFGYLYEALFSSGRWLFGTRVEGVGLRTPGRQPASWRPTAKHTWLRS